MKINNKKELKRIAEEKSGHLDYKDFINSFMLIGTRPTARVPFKKNFDELINL